MDHTIFVLDDDPLLGELMVEGLATRGFSARAFSDPIRALAALSQERADVLLTDLSMPWVDGKDVVCSARSRQPDLQIVLMSGFPRGAEVAALEHVRFLRKPIDLDGLLGAVDDALAARVP
jgi:two-component system OmpR family response regulator/two-component system response regulator QseB